MVLKDSKMPAVLVECGFMSNVTEEAYLSSDKGQSLIASAIFRAFRDYIEKRHGIKQNNLRTIDKTKTPSYKIQILASNTPVSTDMPDFKLIGEEIEEINCGPIIFLGNEFFDALPIKQIYIKKK